MKRRSLFVLCHRGGVDRCRVLGRRATAPPTPRDSGGGSGEPVRDHPVARLRRSPANATASRTTKRDSIGAADRRVQRRRTPTSRSTTSSAVQQRQRAAEGHRGAAGRTSSPTSPTSTAPRCPQLVAARRASSTSPTASPSPTSDWDDFFPGAQAAATVDGRVLGVPALIDNLAIVYNKELFDEADIDPPTADWTWEDFRAAAKALTDPANEAVRVRVPGRRQRGHRVALRRDAVGGGRRHPQRRQHRGGVQLRGRPAAR